MKTEITSYQKKHLLVLFILIPFILGIGVDLYAPSLPAINSFFKAPTHLTQLSIGLYMLGYSLGQILLGTMSDFMGRRIITLCTGAVYVIVSFLAAYSPNIYCLIFLRLLQGFAIAGPATICRAIVTDCFSGVELSKAMTYISTSWGIGPIIGPYIGGYLQHYFGWQANFIFYGLFSLVTFAYAALTLKETRLNPSKFHSTTLFNMLKEVATHKVFFMYALIGAIVYSVLVIFNLFAPFLFQNHLHYSAVEYGHIALTLGVAYFLGSFSNRFFLNFASPFNIIRYGIFASAAISVIMLFLNIFYEPNIFNVVIPTFIIFFCAGFIYPNVMAKGSSIFPNMGGTASAVYGFFVSGGVFIFSSLIMALPTENAIPLAIIYIVLQLIAILLLNYCKEK